LFTLLKAWMKSWNADDTDWLKPNADDTDFSSMLVRAFRSFQKF